MEHNPKLVINPDGSARDRIVGFETEYGLIFEENDSNQHAEDPMALIDTPAVLYDDDGVNRYTKYSVFKILKSFAPKEFTPDGNRVYLDIGLHPEFSTAEETSFVGAAYRVLLGHLTMKNIFAKYDSESPNKDREIVLMANTVDRFGNSWGSHENMLTRRALEFADIIPALTTHHLSRIVWSGAGYVQERSSKSDYDFHLSEKALHIWENVSSATTRSRPLVNTRDEPLAEIGKYRRIHTVAGESVFSPFVNALRLASGSIILRACEIGTNFSDLEISNPIGAIRRISADTTLTATVELADGRNYSGLDLQRAIAERAFSAAEAREYITEQETEWANNWIKLLDDLSIDPMYCGNKLDWVVKKKLVEREVASKAPSHTSPFATASAKSLVYHRLYPKEGKGMEIARRGFFEYSPDAQIFEDGLPLPSTRAAVRGRAVQRLENSGLVHLVDWDSIGCEGVGCIRLGDPYESQSERVENLIDRATELPEPNAI